MVLTKLRVEEVSLALKLLGTSDVLEDKLMVGGSQDISMRGDQCEWLLETIVQGEVIWLRVENHLHQNNYHKDAFYKSLS